MTFSQDGVQRSIETRVSVEDANHLKFTSTRWPTPVYHPKTGWRIEYKLRNRTGRGRRSRDNDADAAANLLARWIFGLMPLVVGFSILLSKDRSRSKRPSPPFLTFVGHPHRRVESGTAGDKSRETAGFS